MRWLTYLQTNGNNECPALRYGVQHFQGFAYFRLDVSPFVDGLRRQQGHEEVALFDGCGNLRLPVLAADQILRVKPWLSTSLLQVGVKAYCRLPILFRIADEYTRRVPIRSAGHDPTIIRRFAPGLPQA